MGAESVGHVGREGGDLEAHLRCTFHRTDVGPGVGKEHVFRAAILFSDCDLDGGLHGHHLHDV